MKTKDFITCLGDRCVGQFVRDSGLAVGPSGARGSYRLYLGDGNYGGDFLVLDAQEIRALAKRFNKLADSLDPTPTNPS